jgi:hypothetical protein
VLQLVEEPVHRLEAQVGHSDEIRIRKRQRDAQPPTVRFADEADLAGENVVRAPAVNALRHENCRCRAGTERSWCGIFSSKDNDPAYRGYT